MSNKQAPRIDAKEKEEGSSFPDIFLPLRTMVANISPKDRKARWLLLAIMVIADLYFFFEFIETGYSAMIKFLVVLVVFMISGEIFRGLMDWGGFYGLIMFRDKRTLGWIDRQANRFRPLWNFLSDISLVLGYGLASWFLMDKQKKNKAYLLTVYLIGFLLLFIFSGVIAQKALPVLSGIVTDNTFESASGRLTETIRDNVVSGNGVDIGSGMQIPIFSIFMFLVMICGGLASSMVVSLSLYAIMLVPPLITKMIAVVMSTAGMAQDTVAVPEPGGSPLIPGANLPIIEGILALAVLLMVHEMSHGFLARIAKVRLDSAGVVFFGALPFGAFVEPDDKEMEKIPKYKSNRIIVAGSGANMITAMITFVILMVALGVTEDYRVSYYEITHDLRDGQLLDGDQNLTIKSQVLSIEGIEYIGAETDLNFEQGSIITIHTDKGDFRRVVDEDGKLGVMMQYIDKSGMQFKYKFIEGYEWMRFVFNTLGLVFALNVFIGIVNLLPVPMFDGYYLMKSIVRNDKIATAITYLVVGAFLLNFLPWIFK